LPDVGHREQIGAETIGQNQPPVWVLTRGICQPLARERLR
jgi:hypothetical protein